MASPRGIPRVRVPALPGITHPTSRPSPDSRVTPSETVLPTREPVVGMFWEMEPHPVPRLPGHHAPTRCPDKARGSGEGETSQGREGAPCAPEEVKAPF